MTIKADLTPTQYSFDIVQFQKDGTARVRVRLYGPKNNPLDTRWVDLGLTQAAKDTLIAKRDAKIAALASDNGLTEYIEEEI